MSRVADPAARIIASLGHAKQSPRVNAARAAASKPPPVPGLASALITAVEQLPARLEAEKGRVHWGDRLGEEQELLRALSRHAGDPELPRELPRVAGRLIEIAGNPDADDSDDGLDVARTAASLLARFGVPGRLAPVLAELLVRDRVGRAIRESIVEALGRTGGPAALEALRAEAKRVRRGVPWSAAESIGAALERARASVQPRA